MNFIRLFGLWTIAGIVAAVSLSACAHRAIEQDPLLQDLDEMMSWFPGHYENHIQVYREAVEGVPQKDRQRHTYHIFSQADVAGIPRPQIYAEQSQHYDRADLYRQRIYSFTIDTEKQAVKLTIYTPKDPSRLTGAFENPDLFDALTEQDFFLKPGCEVYWQKKGDQFEGRLEDNACSYFSKKFNTRVYLNETLILRKDALLLHDTAVDENGEPVFGSSYRGPTVNLKKD